MLLAITVYFSLMFISILLSIYSLALSDCSVGGKQNTNFIEADLLHVTGSACCTETPDPSPVTPVECCERCGRQHECEGWVLDTTNYQCYLLRSRVPGKGMVYAPRRSRVAGYKTLPNHLVTRAPSDPGSLRIMMKSREDVTEVLNYQQPRGMGVILGVGRGEFSLHLLEHWTQSGGLYLVDPYINVWRGYLDPDNLSDKEHQMVYEALKNELHERFEFK